MAHFTGFVEKWAGRFMECCSRTASSSTATQTTLSGQRSPTWAPSTRSTGVASPASESELIDKKEVAAYLVARGVLERVEGVEVEELAGGISGAVYAVRGEGKRLVVKQALERFRVEDEWLVPPERALDEGAALELMAEIVPGSVPALIDLDRERFVLVMEEAPRAG